MARRRITVDGTEWTVELGGFRTQYLRDEFPLVFRRGPGPGVEAEQRVIRYSPRGARVRERSLAELTDAQLEDLLRRSQPAWTSPDLGYAR
jgi:hypothetical protein